MLEHGFELSRMIAFSKSTYKSRKPDNLVVFNANVVAAQGKIWWGDLDLTEDSEKLQCVVNDIGCDLYILREMDCRFGNETRPFYEVEQLAVKKFTPQAQAKPTHKKSITQWLRYSAYKVVRFFSATPKQ